MDEMVDTFLPPVEKPKGLIMKLAYAMARRRFGKVLTTVNEAGFNALDEYRTSALFTEAERAALDYVTQLTRDKKVVPDTFRRCPGTFPSAKSVRSCGLWPASTFTT